MKALIEKNQGKVNVTRSHAISMPVSAREDDTIRVPNVGTLSPKNVKVYTHAKLDHESIVASHRGALRSNVAQFIKDQGLGTRHYLSKGEVMSHTTANDTHGYLSEND